MILPSQPAFSPRLKDASFCCSPSPYPSRWLFHGLFLIPCLITFGSYSVAGFSLSLILPSQTAFQMPIDSRTCLVAAGCLGVLYCFYAGGAEQILFGAWANSIVGKISQSPSLGSCLSWQPFKSRYMAFAQSVILNAEANVVTGKLELSILLA